MSCNWRDPIRLSKPVRLLFFVFEYVPTAVLSMMPFFLIKDRPEMDWWIVVAIIIGILGILSTVTYRVLDNIGAAEKQYIECVLDVLGHDIWNRTPDKLDGAKEQHRVTLFQLKRCWLRKVWRRDPCTHRLIPRARAPSSSSNPHRVFYVHNKKQKLCKGIAGLVFANGSRALVKENLPDLQANDHIADQEVRKYAVMTNDDYKTVKNQSYYARSIGGICIYVDRKRWGVLLLDSPDPKGLSVERFSNSHGIRIVSLLSRILEGKKP